MPSSSGVLRPTRRTRIVCISDTHNSTIKLPKGDVLIHAGDLTNQGSYSEVRRAVQWLEKADFEAKIVIAGNHDITLDHDFYAKHGSNFHNNNPQDPARCLSLLTGSRTITYLQHSSATVRLTRPDGPCTEFKVFGSPYCPEYGTWAFMYKYPRPGLGAEASRSDDSPTAANPSAAELWAAIPPDTDILVTHTPAYTHCDDSFGCENLREALAKVRPRVHVCGHVHQGRGAERVRWDTDGLSVRNEVAAQVSVERWQDPAPDPSSAKISLVDLTGRGGKRPLDFHDRASLNGAQALYGTYDVPDPAQELSGSSPTDLAGRNDNTSALEPEARPGSTNTAGALDRAGRRETCVINWYVKSAMFVSLSGCLGGHCAPETGTFTSKAPPTTH
ncbi:Metallo-dependent phosphatase-like protein [Chaetomium strumarium]|uniref:Metallo-dependent phosphatase-like protein n=1 Tax=Chaetomium strumarium TaxID=1170767 RepID=A0AAJ0GY15_9PEZI|nr:Metallo-dependent phosphatase-like protein [Chaetomium strumarium]